MNKVIIGLAILAVVFAPYVWVAMREKNQED